MGTILHRDSKTGMPEGKKPKISNLEIDASINETHVFESEVPQYTTEEGFPISDNIRNKPYTVRMEGIVSAYSWSPKSTSVDEAKQELYKIRDKKEPVTLYTPFRVYRNMSLKKIEFPRRADTNADLKFTADFVQIEIAKTKFINVDVEKNQVSKNVAEKEETSNEPKKDVNEEIEKDGIFAFSEPTAQQSTGVKESKIIDSANERLAR